MIKYIIVFVNDGRYGDILQEADDDIQLVEYLYSSISAALKSNFFAGGHPWDGCYYIFSWDDATNEIRCVS